VCSSDLEAVHLLDEDTRDTLGIAGLVRLRVADYLEMPIPEAPAA